MTFLKEEPHIIISFGESISTFFNIATPTKRGNSSKIESPIIHTVISVLKIVFSSLLYQGWQH